MAPPMASTQAEELALREALEKARKAKEEAERVEKFTHDAKHKILPGLQKKRYTTLNQEIDAAEEAAGRAKPRTRKAPPKPRGALPEGWTVELSQSVNQWFYHHWESVSSQWELSLIHI